MRRIGFELTDRCNLACRHCLRNINAERRYLDETLVKRTLAEAALLGFVEAVFTGGEPTLHPNLSGMANAAFDASLALTIVTNGQRSEPLWKALAHHRARALATVALSLEAADEAGFESVRGKKTWRRFLHTMLGCQARHIRTILSATIGPWNLHQAQPIVNLAHQLGLSGVSLAAYQPTVRPLGGYNIEEYATLTSHLEAVAKLAPLPVTLSFEPITLRATHLCSTLSLNDININYRGEATFCCQLSSLYHAPEPNKIVVANLAECRLEDVIVRQVERVAAFLQEKLVAWRQGPPFSDDRHPCLYCLRAFSQCPKTFSEVQDAA